MCLAVSGARPRISLGILSGPGVLFLDRVERRVWKVVVSLMVSNMSMGVSGVAVCMPPFSLSSPSVQGGGVSMRGGGGAARRVEKKVWMASCMPAGSDTVSRHMACWTRGVLDMTRCNCNENRQYNKTAASSV